MNIIWALLILNLLIGIHELGHFLAAKMCKVGVDEFALGMGPKIISRKSSKDGTIYSLRWILLGGYVKLNDEDFQNSEWYKHLIIIIAGVVFNLIFALIGIWIYIFLSDIINVGFFAGFVLGFKLVFAMLKEIYIAVFELFKTVDTTSLSGPVGVVDVVSSYVSTGFINAVEIFAVLNLNLFVMNLLPIPMLDGGQAVLILIKKLFNKKEMPKFEVVWNIIGLIILGLILFFALKNDILSLFNIKK